MTDDIVGEYEKDSKFGIRVTKDGDYYSVDRNQGNDGPATYGFNTNLLLTYDEMKQFLEEWKNSEDKRWSGFWKKKYGKYIDMSDKNRKEFWSKNPGGSMQKIGDIYQDPETGKTFLLKNPQEFGHRQRIKLGVFDDTDFESFSGSYKVSGEKPKIGYFEMDDGRYCAIIVSGNDVAPNGAEIQAFLYQEGIDEVVIDKHGSPILPLVFPKVFATISEGVSFIESKLTEPVSEKKLKLIGFSERQ